MVLTVILNIVLTKVLLVISGHVGFSYTISHTIKMNSIGLI